MPPGRATKQPERWAISALRSCIVSTTTRSVTSRWPISRSSRARGMIPVTRPPAAIAASATAPIRPTAPPP